MQYRSTNPKGKAYINSPSTLQASTCTYVAVIIYSRLQLNLTISHFEACLSVMAPPSHQPEHGK